MYLRRCYRQKDEKRHAYWTLVESYRTARGPRQRVVAYLGELHEQGRLGVQQVVQPEPAPQADLFKQDASVCHECGNRNVVFEMVEDPPESIYRDWFQTAVCG